MMLRMLVSRLLRPANKMPATIIRWVICSSTEFLLICELHGCCWWMRVLQFWTLGYWRRARVGVIMHSCGVASNFRLQGVHCLICDGSFIVTVTGLHSSVCWSLC